MPAGVTGKDLVGALPHLHYGRARKSGELPEVIERETDRIGQGLILGASHVSQKCDEIIDAQDQLVMICSQCSGDLLRGREFAG